MPVDVFNEQNCLTGGTLYLIVPCFNEEAALPHSAPVLRQQLQVLKDNNGVALSSRVLFVNDGSTDGTWEAIKALHSEAPDVFSGLNLSCNRGHQNALLAGLMAVKDIADVTITIDADLQDDIAVMGDMIELFNQGVDVVYGVRSRRKKDSFFKRFTARSFYRAMRLLGADVVFDHADYRLMSKRALLGLAKFEEVNLFLRGLVPLVGYSHAMVAYERAERVAGETKYPLRKMLAFALEGVTSLSTKPLRLISLLGVAVFIVSIVASVYVLMQFLAGKTVPGWASTTLSTWGIGGLMIFSLGVVGEYIGKIYMETKARPRYLIESFLNDRDDS